MTCDELLRQLAAFEDGALPDPVCQELERHLAACEPCQGLRADLEALARMCRCGEPPRLPEAVRQRLAKRLGGASR